MLVSALLIFAMSEVGFRLGRRKEASLDDSDPSSLLETTAFTLLALLLGFSFSLALGRYDARRGALLREANAIGTTFLRAEFFDAKTVSAVRADLRSYVAERIAYARADAQPDQRRLADRNSTTLQRDLWKLATQAANRDPHSTTVPLFIAALNDTINLSTEERAVLNTHIPDVVIIWLLLIAFIASAMMGYRFGHQGKRARIFEVVFAVMVALVFGLVLDLDRPQRGIIRINLAPLQSAQQLMNATATGLNQR
jgi:hypothetical protein